MVQVSVIRVRLAALPVRMCGGLKGHMQSRLYIAAEDGIMHARCDNIFVNIDTIMRLRNLIGRLADTWDACIVTTLLDLCKLTKTAKVTFRPSMEESQS